MEAWIGIVGVLLGGGLSWWGTWSTTGRQIAAERELRQAEQRRSGALPVASRLIGATDELWSSSQSVAAAVSDLVIERQAYDGSDKAALMRALAQRRLSHMGTRADAVQRARQAAAELAIVSQDLEESANALVAASDFTPKSPGFIPVPSENEARARAMARKLFILRTRRVLTDS